MSVLATKNLWRALLIALAVAFVYFQVFVKLSKDWWNDENYSHGLLIPFIIGYILWSQRERLAKEPAHPSTWLGGGAIVLALMGLFSGVAGAELYVQRLSFILLLAGIVIYFWGARLLRYMVVPFALLFLAMPIPVIVFNKIAFPLQLFASRCAVWSMRAMDIPVLRQGNVIELLPLNSLQTKKLEVVEACSGIRSLMTLLTLAVVFAYFTYPSSGSKVDGSDKSSGRFSWLKSYGFWRSFILVGSAIPIAIITNASRVSGTGVLAHYYGTEVADGFFHSFSGWVVYIVAFLLLFAVGWLLERFHGGKSSKSNTKEVTLGTKRVKAAVATGRVAESEGND